VADAYVSGRIALEHLRGRSCFPFAVQAAEIALREREALDGIGEVEFERAERDAGLVRATFVTPAGRFTVTIIIEAAEPHFLTCQSRHEEAAPAYRLDSIRRA
jgi:hypothetical protein